jgi:hypothetical protein
VIITIDILKKINGSIASGKFFTMGEIAQECCLDEKVLEVVGGDLNNNVTSMNTFLKTMDAYLSEMQKRVKMLNECYNAIQKLQLTHGVIKKGAGDPPIVW